MSDFSFITVRDGKIMIPVRAFPGAAKTEIVGIYARTLKVRIAAAPERGKANSELETFFAGIAGIAGNKAKVVKGLASRNKVVELEDENPSRLISFLEKKFPLG